mmetsp:Transcript_22463/g.66000  ORF Transcript_22463/g.66000 Transcript_22463/m.66000 type:complete len:250 (+) Transcript_22463:697-1446(+)
MARQSGRKGCTSPRVPSVTISGRRGNPQPAAAAAAAAADATPAADAAPAAPPLRARLLERAASPSCAAPPPPPPPPRRRCCRASPSRTLASCERASRRRAGLRLPSWPPSSPPARPRWRSRSVRWTCTRRRRGLALCSRRCRRSGGAAACGSSPSARRCRGRSGVGPTRCGWRRCRTRTRFRAAPPPCTMAVRARAPPPPPPACRPWWCRFWRGPTSPRSRRGWSRAPPLSISPPPLAPPPTSPARSPP